MSSSVKHSYRKSSPDIISSDLIIEEQVSQPNGDISIIKYSKKQFLGKGGFARVYEFYCLDTQKTYASKIISKDNLVKQRRKQKLMSEIKIHRSLTHQNIVQFEHFFEDSENVYILLEICSNQTMSELLRRRKRLTELEVQCYAIQIISAMSHIHSKKIILQNIFVICMFKDLPNVLKTYKRS